jgi:manganese/zinc/iron transport system ATP- binding protein
MTKQEKKIALQIEDLTVAYRNTPVLWDVDVRIPQGALVAIVGPNGAGKSTLIKAALELIKPLSGKVRFFNETYSTYHKKIAYVPQKEAVNWDFPTTVLDAVTMGRYGALGWFKRVKREDKALALQALERLHMETFAGRHISELSGGQQQRVFLARALVQNVNFYFLDEPFVGIDKQTEQIIIDILRELQRENKTIVVVHHDLSTIADYFDYIVMLDKVVIAQGPVKTTFIPANIEQTFGIKERVK